MDNKDNKKAMSKILIKNKNKMIKISIQPTNLTNSTTKNILNSKNSTLKDKTIPSQALNNNSKINKVKNNMHQIIKILIINKDYKNNNQ